MERVAANCYIPANERILECIKQSRGEFKVAFSLSGTVIEQMKAYAPEALESFKALAKTGCVEFLGETYYHSLASLYDTQEFCDQVQLHSALIQREFGQRPRVFRNTELIYDDKVGAQVSALGFEGIVAEGAQDILGWRSPNFVYRALGSTAKLLLRNYTLSDDIAFRFGGHSNGEVASLQPETYATWLHELTGNADVVGLFLDYETFGEHHRKASGIFDFLSSLPACVLAHNEWKFVTPSEALRLLHPVTELSCPRVASWADVERDVSAWCGNRMQQGALAAIYDIECLYGQRDIHGAGMEEACETWRRLQTSDHFYYMSTKGAEDGAVHRYFSPFESPYDAFIAYMNVLKDIARRSEVGQRDALTSSSLTGWGDPRIADRGDRPVR
jgi:alpha-amylase